MQGFFEGIKKNSFHKVQIGDSECNTKGKLGKQEGRMEELKKDNPKDSKITSYLSLPTDIY